MRKRPVLSVSLALALAVSMLLTACSQATTSPTPTPTKTTAPPTSQPTTTAPSPTPTQTQAIQPQYGGIFKWAKVTGPRELSPWTASTTTAYTKLTHDTLVSLDKNRELAPGLATSWKFDSDYKSLTMTIRKGVRFHDGTDLNAAAVKYAIEKRKAAKLGDYDQVSSVDAVDDYTVRLNLSQFNNALLISLWFYGGYIGSPTAYQKYGPEASMWNPVGTGAFKFVTYQPNQSVTYTKFDGYWRTGRPYLDGWITSLIADPTTQSMAFRRNEVDYISEVPAKETNDLVLSGYKDLVTPPGVAAGDMSVMIPDSANADSPFAKKEVREALQYAIDREGIVKAVGYNLFEPLTQITDKASYAYNPAVKGRPYNPEKAKQLLAAAGYSNGFKVNIYCRQGTVAMDFLVAAATNLKAVGIEATVQPTAISQYSALTTGGWKGLVAGTMFMSPDWLMRQYIAMSITSTTSFPSMTRATGLQPLLEQAIQARDSASRNKLCQEIVKLVSDEAMIVPNFRDQRGSIYHNNVNNPEGLSDMPAYLGVGDVWMSK